jgi:hypothetical protein
LLSGCCIASGSNSPPATGTVSPNSGWHEWLHFVLTDVLEFDAAGVLIAQRCLYRVDKNALNYLGNLPSDCRPRSPSLAKLR